MPAHPATRNQTGIFIGSTDDPVTREFRMAASHIVEEFGKDWYPVEMGTFTPDNPPPAETCKEKVLSCKVYVCIVGPIYGSICEEAGMSFTQYEYSVARDSQTMQIGVFILPEDLISAVPPKLIWEQQKFGDRQIAFRHEVSQETTVCNVPYMVEFEKIMAEFRKKFRQYMHELPDRLRAEESSQNESANNWLGSGENYDQRAVLRHGLIDLDSKIIRTLLTSERAQTELGRYGLLNASQDEQLAGLRLMSNNKPNVGLFLSTAPRILLTDKLASSGLHLVVHSGTRKGSSRLIYNENIYDNLVNLYDTGMAFFRTQLKRRGEVGSPDRDDLEIPMFALREAFTNALIHRDYEHAFVRAQPTTVEVFDDRVEITSFGGLVPGISEKKLNEDPEHIPSIRRNHAIAEVFSYLARAELTASGVARMQEVMIKADLPKPRITEEIGELPHVRVTLNRLQRHVYQLPPRTPGFTGRGGDLERLCADVLRAQTESAAVAVTGMGGVGKSALAAEAVHKLAEDFGAFPGGIAWVRCDRRVGLSGLAWVEDQLLAAWGAGLTSNELMRASTPEQEVEIRERALVTRLQPVQRGEKTLPALALLDNVELDLPIERAIEFLTSLGMTVLLTMRHEPRLSRLRLHRLGVLDGDSAIKFFSRRYAERGGTWDDTRDRPAASDIVEALGKLPLAIEVAAARAARTPRGVAALADELRQSNALEHLSDPLGEINVQLVLSRSLDLLDPVQQVHFAALGLPDGADWPRQIIRRLFAAVPVSGVTRNTLAGDDLDILASLSLIAFLPSESPRQSEPRVRLHPLLRDLARQQWAKQDVATRQNGLTSLLAAVSDLVATNRHDFTRLAHEEELIAGTLRHAANEHVGTWQFSPIIDNLTHYIIQGGHWRLGEELFGLKLENCRELRDEVGEADALTSMASIAISLGKPDDASNYYTQALQIFTKLGATHSVSEVNKALKSLDEMLPPKSESGKPPTSDSIVIAAPQDRPSRQSASASDLPKRQPGLLRRLIRKLRLSGEAS